MYPLTYFVSALVRHSNNYFNYFSNYLKITYMIKYEQVIQNMNLKINKNK